MITAVDTNVILDVLLPDATHGAESEKALFEATRAGAIVINELVYAELSAGFPDKADLDDFLDETGLLIEPSRSEALYKAGVAWRQYLQRRPAGLLCPACNAVQEATCQRCGSVIQSRQHLVADFVIGAHALAQADQLLTRDRGYYSTYFPDLKLA